MIVGVGLPSPVGIVGLSNSLLDGVDDRARVAVYVSCVGLGTARTHACVLACRGDLRRVNFEPLDIGYIGGYYLGVLGCESVELSVERLRKIRICILQQRPTGYAVS